MTVSNQVERLARTGRLEGLDLARFFAFVGMVIVNFTIVMGAEGMGAEGGEGPLAWFTLALEGRAAATFVVLSCARAASGRIEGEVEAYTRKA